MAVVNLSMSKNFFHLLGLTPSYLLDLQDLEGRYLKLQEAIHPDRYITKTEMEKSLALKHSADLNQAYQALKCPLKRAAAFLDAMDVAIPGKQGQTIQNPHLLMEVMEWQEAIGDASSLKEIAPIQAQLEERVQTITSSFDTSSLQELGDLYSELSYLLKLQEEIKHKGF